ncbi:MAG: hypothetical protein JW953_17340 [Anaerolineae bacterium]|nr:hypothetical protein [Anaerolineae bacterium]
MDDIFDYDLVNCPRCDGADARPGEVCFFCQRELEAHHDHEMGWRKAWELEKDDELRRNMQQDPNYPQRVLAELDAYASKFQDDRDLVKRVEGEKAKFMERVKRVSKYAEN